MAPAQSNIEKDIRHVVGEVDINFFANSFDNEVRVMRTSREDSLYAATDPFDKYYPQLFTTGLEFKHKIARTTLPEEELEVLDGTWHLADESSLVGWFGDKISGTDGLFGERIKDEFGNYTGATADEQWILVRFSHERVIHHFDILGDDLLDEYPTEFRVELYKTTPTFDEEGKIEEGRRPQERLPRECDKCKWRVVFNQPEVARYARLVITKWSRPNATAKIKHFSAELELKFTSDELKRIEVLEEKSPDAEQLSYGISANQCKLEFLNRDKMFYRKEYFELLRPHRLVRPVIKCGNDKPLEFGNFYSQEFQISNDSQFISCTAYDMLIQLQGLNISFEMEKRQEACNDDCEMDCDKSRHPIVQGVYHLRQDITVSDLLKDIQRKVNLERHRKGIYGRDIKIVERGEKRVRFTSKDVKKLLELEDPKFPQEVAALRKLELSVDEKEEMIKNGFDVIVLAGAFVPNIQYLLLGEDTAWNILQQAANYAQAWVYINREGEIVFEYDDFDILRGLGRVVRNGENSMADINQSNSFNYSLPLASKMLVNQVNVACYELVDENESEYEISVRARTFNEPVQQSNGKWKHNVTVSLGKVFKVIDEKICQIRFETTNIDGTMRRGAIFGVDIIKASYNRLEISFEHTPALTEFDVVIVSKAYNAENKNISVEDGESINTNGLHQFKLSAGKLFVADDIDVIEANAEKIGDKLLDKYAKPRQYVNTKWKGNFKLHHGANFKGKSIHQQGYNVFDCLSLETTYDGSYRQTIKGREIVEQKRRDRESTS